jgi:Rps23 Pro-64 3,4-dihydroxylase Tpa1-like proline 4-hydroxylase
MKELKVASAWPVVAFIPIDPSATMNSPDPAFQSVSRLTSLYHLPTAEQLTRMAGEYAGAKPFPHIVLDNFLSPKISSGNVQFPEFSWPGWKQFRDGYQFGKRVCNDIEVFPEVLRALLREACEPRFLQFLEKLTGIDGLLPDPYLSGGGLHSSGPGGILAAHTDFHIYSELSLYRRLNLIIYFNDDWTESDGGALELTEKGEAAPMVAVLPLFGRAVIFNTDDISVHGFSKPIAEGKRRNSLALYYYTAKEVGVYSGDRTTHWQEHGSRSGLHSVRVLAYKSLLLASRALSRLAHMANPNVTSNAREGVTTNKG